MFSVLRDISISVVAARSNCFSALQTARTAVHETMTVVGNICLLLFKYGRLLKLPVRIRMKLCWICFRNGMKLLDLTRQKLVKYYIIVKELCNILRGINYNSNLWVNDLRKESVSFCWAVCDSCRWQRDTAVVWQAVGCCKLASTKYSELPQLVVDTYSKQRQWFLLQLNFSGDE